MTTWCKNPAWGVVDRPESGEHGGVLYAADLVTGTVHALTGPAAVVVRAALEGHDPADIREQAAQGLGVEVEDVDEVAVLELVKELVVLGLLRARLLR